VLGPLRARVSHGYQTPPDEIAAPEGVLLVRAGSDRDPSAVLKHEEAEGGGTNGVVDE
jgi:hypothetical protein